MGSYEIAPEQALESAIRVVKEGRVQGIKLEGGRDFAPTIQRIIRAGIPVLGHVGLTPQRQNTLGGFRVQGKTTAGALQILEDAIAVQEAGCFAVVIEAVPPEVARLVTERLRIPTIGIGAGNGCSGQVLVQVDMTGNFPPGRFLPKFVKQYGNVWAESMKAIETYKGKPVPLHTSISLTLTLLQPKSKAAPIHLRSIHIPCPKQSSMSSSNFSEHDYIDVFCCIVGVYLMWLCILDGVVERMFWIMIMTYRTLDISSYLEWGSDGGTVWFG
jgi:hypothetical protein